MNLVSLRIITANVEALIKFYEQSLGVTPVQYTPDFAELQTKTATLAVGSTRTLQFFGGDSEAQSAKNHRAIIEFLVEDVDREFERLREFIEPYLVQKPTMMPWGNKSFLFRDPDGNLVNFFTPVSPEAVKKFEGK